GATSATLFDQSSRAFQLRRGAAVVNAGRFASAFFGKAQFVAGRWTKTGAVYRAGQWLEGPYFQTFDPPRKMGTEEWAGTRAMRRQSEVCRLEQLMSVTERANGFSVRVQSHGTSGVPVAIEINLREGGTIGGVTPAPHVADGWLLASGHGTY